MYQTALKEFHQKSGLQRHSHFLPLAVDVDRIKSTNKSFTKQYFNLPNSSFLFLYVFDFSSHILRKNPEALIKAFIKAFTKLPASKKYSDVGLVLKVMNVKEGDKVWKSLSKLFQKDSRIHVIEKTMDRPEILGLIKACDAYVSPHRAEGFGRTLAEAMLLGKPVIATNYSGNATFMHPELTLPVDFELIDILDGQYHFIQESDKARWAEPSIEHLALQMKAALNKANDQEFIKRLKEYSEGLFSPQRVGSLMKKRLQDIVSTNYKN
jgi:glycosyltransferase involved in cell wall biosynthesis